MGLALTAAIAWSTAPLLSLSLGQASVLAVAFSTTVSLASAVSWLWLGWLERQLYEGRDVPLRNLAEKK